MGRAIVREPEVFLMDEPLSNLDAKLRVQMRAEISRIQRRVDTTTIYVTHDQTEAMTLGDVVAVMKDGQVQQAASPHDLYEHPANLFVAGFIGSPAMNMAEANIDETDGDLSVALGRSRSYASRLRSSRLGPPCAPTQVVGRRRHPARGHRGREPRQGGSRGSTHRSRGRAPGGHGIGDPPPLHRGRSEGADGRCQGVGHRGGRPAGKPVVRTTSCGATERHGPATVRAPATPLLTSDLPLEAILGVTGSE